MKRHLAWLLLLGVVWATPALGRTFVRFNIGFWAPPPPPAVFYEPPPVAWVPGTAVYYVDEDGFPYDCFRYGGFYYLDYDGYWYRSPGYRGPWIAVQASFVPRPIFSVPASYWRHGGYGEGWSRGRYGSDRSFDRGRGRDDERWWGGGWSQRRDAYRAAGERRGESRGWGRGSGEERGPGDRGRGEHGRGEHGDHGRG